jgi:iron complex transport system permease protein
MRMGIRNKTFLYFFLITVPILSLLVSLICGRYIVPPENVAGVLCSKILYVRPFWTPTDELIVINLRLPRILLAMLIGAGLSVSGASFQGIFRNPLVSPDILGVASGAAFGGVLAMVLFKENASTFVLAFVFGLVALIVAYFISRVGKSSSILMLVLSGVIVNALFTAVLSLLKCVADPRDTLPAIEFWLMGSLTSSSYEQLNLIGVPMIICIIILFLLRWRINLLSLGDEDAQSLGVNTEGLRCIIIICVTIIVALAVSISGIIGWVGLAIPHIARMVVGPDHKILVPTSISFGSVFLLLIDDLARTLTSAEIPLGILTAIVGVVVFGYLLRRTHGRGWIDA